MEEYKRDYPLFSLCGLNCGLCPRYHTNGDSKCPGCGGKDFHLKHPSCSVITCSKKHDNVEYCFQCSAFPCEKYSKPGNKDSFISYCNVACDFEKAKKDIESYKNELNEKIDILELLIKDYNDGRNKNFYCLAVNLLKLSDLKDVINEINENIDKQEIPLKKKIEQIALLFELKAKKENIKLQLRK